MIEAKETYYRGKRDLVLTVCRLPAVSPDVSTAAHTTNILYIGTGVPAREQSSLFVRHKCAGTAGGASRRKM
jgi:hypothetical protein